MKKYNIIETNAKGTSVKLKFQSNDQNKARRVFEDFVSEDAETEYHLMKIDDNIQVSQVGKAGCKPSST